MNRSVGLLSLILSALIFGASLHAQNQSQKDPKENRWNLGLDLAGTTRYLADPGGVQIPIALSFGYDFTQRFQVVSRFHLSFPLRGGYFLSPTLGLRIHSNPFLGSFTAFLGTEIGYAFTNVPWLQNGFMVMTYIGSRYKSVLPLYAEVGLGGGLEVLSNTMNFSYFLNIGYML